MKETDIINCYLECCCHVWDCNQALALVFEECTHRPHTCVSGRSDSGRSHAQTGMGWTDCKLSLTLPLLSVSCLQRVSAPASFCLIFSAWKFLTGMGERRESQQCRKLTWHSKFVTVLCCCFTAQCFQAQRSLLCDIKHMGNHIHAPSFPMRTSSTLLLLQPYTSHTRPHKPSFKENAAKGNTSKAALIGKTLWGC